MTVTINGTTGVTTPEVVLDNSDADGGQVVLKSSGYSNWNWDNYSGRLRAYYNATEYFTINASGNVGIGTSSPDAKLSIKQTANSTLNGLQIIRSDTTAYSVMYMGGDDGLYLQNQANGAMFFYTNNTEKMRIDTSGNLLVGGTGVIYYSKTLSQFDGSSKYGYTANDTSGVASVGFVAFAVNGTTTTGAIGTITRNGSSNAVLYNTTSDQRLKENIADADSALGVVGAIKVRKYDWKEGGQHENFGFVAQELAQVVDNVVSKGRTEEDMWSLDYGKLTPLLVKAIQEQQTMIEQLKADVKALKGQLT